MGKITASATKTGRIMLRHQSLNRRAWFVLFVVAALGSGALLYAQTAGSTFNINSTGDAGDISVGDGVCKQVSQGNDTDSFGATAGSLLGAYLGPGHLEERWLAPFADDLHTTLAQFYERSLAKVARRMGELPRRVAAELTAA